MSRSAVDAILRERRLAEMRVEIDASHAAHSRRGYDPNQPRVLKGNPHGGEWTSTGDHGQTTQTGRVQLAAAKIPKRPNLPNIPPDRPPSPKDEYAIAKEIAKWLAARGEMLLVLATIIPRWLQEYTPTIESYLDPPKSLEELQRGVAEAPKKGYDVHHIVEQSSERAQDRIPRERINAPENLVLIPRLKHKEITGWYGRKNPAYENLPPREWLKGRGWDERYRVGLKALVIHGVLKP